MKVRALISVAVLMVCSMASTPIFAIEYEQDSIVYRLNEDSHTAMVIVGYDTQSLRITLPEKIVYNNTEYTITSIGNSAFMNCQSLEEITISTSVTWVSYHAFQNCSNLMKVTFKSNLCQANIEDNAFEGVGNANYPVALYLPESWDMFYLPEDAFTPWHSGYFWSNYMFDAIKYRSKISNEIDTEAAKVSDWTKTETAKINGYKQDISSEWNRYTINDIKTAAFNYMSQHESRKVEMYGDMATPCDGCPAVEVSDGETTITLYNPEKVEFMKVAE